jgi:hypothetical protein
MGSLLRSVKAAEDLSDAEMGFDGIASDAAEWKNRVMELTQP